MRDGRTNDKRSEDRATQPYGKWRLSFAKSSKLTINLNKKILFCLLFTGSKTQAEPIREKSWDLAKSRPENQGVEILNPSEDAQIV